MRDADVEAVTRLLRAAFQKPDAGAISTARGPDLPLTEDRIRTWRQTAAGAWVADVRGFGPVGAVFAVVEPGAAWLAGLGVAPNFRGAGVGAALLDRSLEFLVASSRSVMGMEVAPTAVAAAALYARRGLRVVDATVRVRGPAAALGAQVVLSGWLETSCSDLNLGTVDLEPSTAARIRAQPRSPDSYLLCGRDVALLCDPDPLVPAAGGSLDLRLVLARRPQALDIADAVRAVARSALARGLDEVEVDLALADGDLLRRLLRLGLTPVASTIRLVSDTDAYAAWRRHNGPIGRWSF